MWTSGFYNLNQVIISLLSYVKQKNEEGGVMSEEKQAKIKKILEMQKKFMALDREQGVEASDYFAPDDESEIAGFREEYRDLAMDIVDLAHKEKGSKK